MPCRTTGISAAVRSSIRATSAARALPAPVAFQSSAGCSGAALRRLELNSVLDSGRQFTTSARVLGNHVPKRGNFKKLGPADVEAFHGMLSNPTSSLFTTIEPATSNADKGTWQPVSPDDLVAFNQDWMDKYKGQSPLLLKPKSTEEVSKILAYCYKERIAVVPQGGNTGLVGGSTPVYDEVILSTEGMKEIRSFDEVSGECQSRRSSIRCRAFEDLYSCMYVVLLPRNSGL